MVARYGRNLARPACEHATLCGGHSERPVQIPATLGARLDPRSLPTGGSSRDGAHEGPTLSAPAHWARAAAAAARVACHGAVEEAAGRRSTDRA
eukprot:scaffold5572_cov390-Prasinococcus_capsulatus_cf.AAC.15